MTTPSQWWNNATTRPADKPVDRTALALAMEQVWRDCLRFRSRPDYIILPGVWFERARPQRQGRRLLKGRWRFKARLQPAFQAMFGLATAVKDRPIR